MSPPLGPLHVTGEVLAAKTVGAFRQLTLVAPGVGERSRPGSFVAVSTGEARLARRALWVHRVRPMGGHRATLDVVVEPRGSGTRWLAGLAPGAAVEVTGPLGHPFPLPREPARCLLVGEGYAAAPPRRCCRWPSACASAPARSTWCSAPPRSPTSSTCSRRAARWRGSMS